MATIGSLAVQPMRAQQHGDRSPTSLMFLVAT